MPSPRVVITHDFMETYGGAERVTQEIAAEFPDAQVVALLARPAVAQRMGVVDRYTSVVPARERILHHYRLGAPVWGAVADRVRLPPADVVVSSSYAYAHRMRTPSGAPIVCYCHSPLRFAWSMTEDYGAASGGGLRQWAFDRFAQRARAADLRASRGVAEYLTQSPFTAEQIRRFYDREAKTIGAPIDCTTFSPGGEPGDYYLLAGRMREPYKRMDVAIEAFRTFGGRLVVAGDGPSRAALERGAPSNVEFVGDLGDDDLVAAMRGCIAAIFPSRDDFGLIPVEVMACGRPVIAFSGGGARHTVVAGQTGEFFDRQDPQSLLRVLATFDHRRYDPAAIREHALHWDRSAFRERIRSAVEQAMTE